MMMQWGLQHVAMLDWEETHLYSVAAHQLVQPHGLSLQLVHGRVGLGQSFGRGVLVSKRELMLKLQVEATV